MTLLAGFERLGQAGLIAAVRADRSEQAVRLAEALVEGGIS